MSPGGRGDQHQGGNYGQPLGLDGVPHLPQQRPHQGGHTGVPRQARAATRRRQGHQVRHWIP